MYDRIRQLKVNGRTNKMSTFQAKSRKEFFVTICHQLLYKEQTKQHYFKFKLRVKQIFCMKTAKIKKNVPLRFK